MFFEISTAITFLAFIANSEGAWDGFTASWNNDTSDGFYKLPQTEITAQQEGWTRVSGLVAPDGMTGLCYQNDPRVILFFAKCTGKVGGVQLGILYSDLTDAGNPYDYASNSAVTKRTMNNEEYLTYRALFNTKKKTIAFEINGTFQAIPTTPAQITSETPYYRKRCVEWMGSHYYTIDPTTSCSIGTSYLPWNLLRVGNEIIGIVMQMIGNSSSAPGRTWYEDLPPSQIAYTIPDAPSCFGEAILKYGLISFHIWFKKDPVAIKCSDECTAVISSTNGTSGHGRKKRAIGSGNVC